MKDTKRIKVAGAAPVDPQIFVLEKLVVMTKAMRRNQNPEVAEVAARFESQFNQELAQVSSKAA